MPKLKKNYLIQKRNVLNEIRANGMSLQELRFFSIYLSKINAQDITTRVVRFAIEDFKVIMELGRIDMSYMTRVTDSLLCKVVNVPNEHGGYTGFQLFKECTVSKDEQGKWYIEIDAHDKALPLMFEFKNRYFTYKLWNALRLKSSNQLRMYEILKQYQAIGYRILSVKDLKALLGVSEKEYSRFNNFKNRVLDACQQALAEYTDIKFTYEPHGKKGPGGKILQIKFTIEKNEDYKDQLTLETFIVEQKTISYDDYAEEEPNERMKFFREACDDEFSGEEIAVLLNKIREHEPFLARDDMQLYHYLNDRYKEMIRQNKKNRIKSRFGYVKSLIEVEL